MLPFRTLAGSAALIALSWAPLAQAAPNAESALSALPDTETLGPPLQPRSAEPRRIFINFDGPLLSHADRDDASRNITRSAALAQQLYPFGGSTLERLAIVQAVRSDFAAFNVAVTSNRPQSGDYVMAVVGPNRPSGDYWENLLGTAFLDCWDAQTKNDVSFAFHDADAEREASDIARTISQEVAHGLGLEHVDDPNDVMYPSSASGDPTFRDDCTSVVPAEGIGIACTAQHLEVCGAADRQNSRDELMMVLGPATRDTRLPQVALAHPLDGMEIELETDFMIEATAADNGAIDRVVLYKNGEAVSEDLEYPFRWSVSEDEISAVEFTVRAYDLDGNFARSTPVTVFVGMDAPMRGNAGNEEGLSCNVTGAPPTSMLLLLLLGAVRRRP